MGSAGSGRFPNNTSFMIEFSWDWHLLLGGRGLNLREGGVQGVPGRPRRLPRPLVSTLSGLSNLTIVSLVFIVIFPPQTFYVKVFL